MYGIGYWLRRHAELHPRRPALIAPERRYSYAELNQEANRAAHALMAVSYTHLTLPTNKRCRSRWSPYH